MKRFFLLLFILPTISVAQEPLTPVQQEYVDSLWGVYSNTDNVAEKVRTLISLDDFWYYADHDSSEALNLKSLSLIEAHLNDNSLSAADLDYLQWAHSRIPINFGLVRHYQGLYEEAMELQDSGYARSKRLGDLEGVAMSLNNKGLILLDQGKYDQAIESFSRALRIAEETENSVGQAILHSVIGDVFLEQQDYDQALSHYFTSKEISELTDDKFAVCQILNSIGVAYLKKEELHTAVDYFDQKRIADSIVDNVQGRGTIADNVGQINMLWGDSARDAGNEELAEVFYQKALQEFGVAIEERIAIEYWHGLSISYINLARLHLRMGLPNEAILSAQKGMEIAQESAQAMEVRDAAEVLYEAYKRLGANESALDMMELFITMRDSINSEENTKAVLRQQYQYEYEKQAATDSIQSAEAAKVKDAEIARQEAEIEAKRKEQFLLFGGLGLVVVFALFIFNRFRVTNKQKKVIVEQKSEVEKQRETAQVQRKEAEHQKHLVEEKNQEIIDSINYARRLQEAILPPQKLVKDYLPDSFILYKPKDIVAGDFYWMETAPLFNSSPDGGEMSEGQRGAVILFAVADCTGHGVPGAMVSVVCSNALTKVLLEEKITEPGKMLDRTRELVIDQFARSEEEVKDGMDISLCALNLKTRELKWAGANNPLWIVRSKEQSTPVVGTHESRQTLPRECELLEIKADKQPIGKYAGEKPFTTHSIQLNEGDSIYIFSDGYPDQFGGEKGKKYKSGKFKKFILSVVNKPHAEQRQLLLDEFESWRGDIEQIDDVCVIGVRV